MKEVFFMSGIAKCWHLVSACYIISVCACVWIVWVQIKSPHLDFSEAEIYIRKPQTTHFPAVFSPSHKRQIRWKPWKPCMCIWELEQLRHSALHPSSDTSSPCALWPLVAGLAMLPRPSASGKQLLPCAQLQSSSRAEEGGKAGQGRVQELSCGFVVCMGRLCPPQLCRLLKHLGKAAALSLQALQTCKKSKKPVDKYDHTHLILDIQVSEFLEMLSYTGLEELYEYCYWI